MGKWSRCSQKSSANSRYVWSLLTPSFQTCTWICVLLIPYLQCRGLNTLDRCRTYWPCFTLTQSFPCRSLHTQFSDLRHYHLRFLQGTTSLPCYVSTENTRIMPSGCKLPSPEMLVPCTGVYLNCVNIAAAQEVCNCFQLSHICSGIFTNWQI